MQYTITTQKELRAAFWEAHPKADRRIIGHFGSSGRMHVCDTRTAWVDYVDHMARSGQISEALADRATLLPYSKE